jgi:hypothetical protein
MTLRQLFWRIARLEARVEEIERQEARDDDSFMVAHQAGPGATRAQKRRAREVVMGLQGSDTRLAPGDSHLAPDDSHL